jgi:callose synthase
MRNQMEHLLMLIANSVEGDVNEVAHRYLAVYRLHGHLFGNYKTWCHRLGAQPCFSGKQPPAGQELMMSEALFESQITDLLLFLFIWGEAANLRHMPESLCFLYHKLMQVRVVIE